MLISYPTWLGADGLKAIVTTYGLAVQRNDEGGAWYVFATDGSVFHETRIIKDNGAEQTDFEASFAALTGRAISSTQLFIDKTKALTTTNDGKLRATAEKTTGTRVNYFSHNFADKTTWYQQSVRVSDETAAVLVVGGVPDYTTYTLAHSQVIDTYHGKLTFEDDLRDAYGNSYRVVVKVDGVAKIEQDPHYGSGGDYTVDYAAGRVVFLSAQTETAVVTVTYYYATTSRFTVKPVAGTELLLDLVEAQLSVDINLTDTIVFEVWGIADYFLPPYIMALLGIPAGVGYMVKLQRNAYKTMSDFYNDTFKSYPLYKAIGNSSNWRSQKADVTVLEWDYLSSVVLYASKGMEIRVFLEHNEPYTGYLSTASFYCLSNPE